MTTDGASKYENGSINNRGDDTDDDGITPLARVGDDASGSAFTPPQNIDMTSPLALSETNEVAATPNEAADIDDIPTSVPLMLSVSSEQGDEILHLGSPKKSASVKPAESAGKAEDTASPKTSSPKKGHKPQKSKDKGSGASSPKKKKKKGHDPQKSGSKHKPQKSGDKGTKKKGKKGKKKKSEKSKH